MHLMWLLLNILFDITQYDSFFLTTLLKIWRDTQHTDTNTEHEHILTKADKSARKKKQPQI